MEKGADSVSPDKLTRPRSLDHPVTVPSPAPTPAPEKQDAVRDPGPSPSATEPAIEAQTSEDEEEDDDDSYPEGGLQAWLVVMGSWMALFSALGLMNTLATFQAYISTHQLADHSEGHIGWIFSLYTFITFFGGIYIGPIFDKHGPRWVILAGTICLVVSLIGFSFATGMPQTPFPVGLSFSFLGKVLYQAWVTNCPTPFFLEYYQFILSFGILSGLASSLLFTPSIAAVGHFFKKRRSFATGIASTGGSIGGVIFPLMLTSLFERVGYAWATRVLALLSFVLCATSNFLIRSRLPPSRDARVHPDFRIFRNVPFLLTTLGIFLLEFALFIPLTYISSYMISSGFDETFSFRILAIVNAASVFGRVLPGYWGDKVGPFNSNISAVLLSVFAALAVWLPFGDTTPGIVVFAVLIGFASGNNISISPVCIGRLCKTQHYGRYYATSYTVVAVACLVSIPVGGEILAATGGEYWGLMVFTGLMYIASFVTLMAAKISCVGWKLLAIF